MKKTKFTGRLEIRVDQILLKEVNRFCKEHREKQSKVLREAVKSYLKIAPLKNLLSEAKIGNPKFCLLLKELLNNSPESLRQFFEGMLIEEEIKAANELPVDTVEIVSTFITDQGRSAYLKRCTKASLFK